MTSQQAIGELGLFLSGSKPIDSVTPAELFELASILAVQGHYHDKLRIYTEMIVSHPQATEEDKVRVGIYILDVLRRVGFPEATISGLRELHKGSWVTPDTRLGQIDWLQAWGQAWLATGQYEPAISAQEELLLMAGKGAPIDKRIYYLQILIHIKMLAGQWYGIGVGDLLEKLRDLVYDPRLTPAMKVRSEESYCQLIARLAEHQGDYECALEVLWVIDEPSAPREQAVSAMLYLSSCSFLNPRPPDPELRRIVDLFQRLKHQLQPTDLEAYREYYSRAEKLSQEVLKTE